jgi:hypothetical protein
VAARYATQSFFFRNTSTNHEEYVHIGALRDTTTQAVVQYPGMFTTVALVASTAAGLDPKTSEYLKIHPGGPGE